MLLVYIVTLLAATVLALNIPCKDGVEIKTEVITNADYMVGNWSYSYHWRSPAERSEPEEYLLNLLTSSGALNCPKIEMEPISPGFRKEQANKCDTVPFKWEDAKLTFTAPLMAIKDGIISLGEKKNWLMVKCGLMIPLEARRVSEDVIVLVNPVDNVSELLSKKPLKASELQCLAHNIDVGKDMDGVVMCVKKN